VGRFFHPWLEAVFGLVFALSLCHLTDFWDADFECSGPLPISPLGRKQWAIWSPLAFVA
jgi:hypothetical protein